jgi:GNAT superfamily N-acetyltransferase
MEAQIRRARPSDVRGLAVVHVRAWQAAYRGLVPDAVLDGLSVDAREGRWRALLAGETRTLVACGGGTVAGFCSVIAPARDPGLSADAAEIAAIYVDPGRWRAGLGRALLETALGELRDEGYATAILWLLEGNDRALRFYSSCGFAPDGATKTEPVGSVERAEGLPQIRLRRAL